MIESNPLGKLVRPIVKLAFILLGIFSIILPMFGTTGASLQQYGGIIVHGVASVFGLIVAAQLSMVIRVTVKIKAPSPVLMGIVIAAVIVGYILGYLFGKLMLNISVVIGIIILILAVLGAVYATAQTGMLLSLAAISPFLLDDEDRETLRRNVKNHAIPLEYTKGRGAQALDRILLEQGLVSRAHVLMSDDEVK